MTPDGENLFVRANYLAVAVFALVLVALPATFELSAQIGRPMKDWYAIVKVILLTLCLFAFPCLRAIRRVIANGTVIPPELVSERPVVTVVVTFFGGLGHFFFVIIMWAAIDIALAPEWPEEAKKILGPMIVGLMCYFIALWCGELALVGNGSSDKARAARAAAL